MKIVFMAPFGIRPKGTVIARMLPLAVELQSLGHEVVIVVPPYTNPEDSGKVEIVRGVTLLNIRLGPHNKALAAPFLAWRMLREVMKEKPDLVHLFKPKGYGGLAAMLHLGLATFGLPLPPLLLDTDDWEGTGGMNDLHGYSSLEKSVYRFQEQWLLRHATAVTVASRGLELLCLDTGVSAERIFYLPNCVSASEPGDGSRIRQRLGIDGAAPVVLLYTRFFEYSQEKLYRTFAEIYRQVPGVRFLVIGKGRGNEESELLAAAAVAGYSDALVMAGWVEPAELPDYLAAGDVAVYPFSNNMMNRCKCPAKFTELLLAGKPVVADRVGQLTEYLGSESGLLCTGDGWQEMADRTVSLLHNPDQSRVMGNDSRNYLLNLFNWRTFALNLHTFYREFIKS